MPSFRTTRVVRHRAADMMALVADVEAYPQFVPLCQSLRVLRHVTDPQGREVITAAMEIGYKAIREKFTSRVALDLPAHTILVTYVDGPFRRMENRWVFRDLADVDGLPRSEVEFFLDYEFRSRTFGMLMGAVFDAAFRRFAEAFERRADVVYAGDRRLTGASTEGKGSSPPAGESGARSATDEGSGDSLR